MQSQTTKTVHDRTPLRPFRATARAVGALYLAGMVFGVVGHLIAQSVLTAPDPLVSIAANGTLLAVGAVLWLFTVAGDTAHGVLMYPLLRRHGERLAIAYLAARIIDATFIAIMTLLIVAQIPLGRAALTADSSGTSALDVTSAVLTQANLYAYEFGMVAVGVAGLVLCGGLHRARLLPRGLTVWGLLGYAVLLGGSVLQVLGFQLSSVHAAPGGLWEVFIGIWLIARGFTASSAPSSVVTASAAAPAVPAQPLARSTR